MSAGFAESPPSDLERTRGSFAEMTPEQRLRLTIKLSERALDVLHRLPNQVQVQAQIAAIEEANRQDFLERMAEITARAKVSTNEGPE